MVADNRILHSIYGKRLGLSRSGSLILDGHIKLPTYLDRGLIFAHYDHFEGATLSTRWTTKKGSDGTCAFPAHVDNVAGGKARFTTGADAGGTMALNGSQLIGARQFDIAKAPASVPVAFGAAIQLSRITNACLFVGFGDQDSALQAPFTISAGTLTANGTDGFGFLFDTAATAATWKGVGVANSVASAILDTGVAPVAATDDVLLIEHDGANCYFWLNGTLKGVLTGCSRAAHNLAPTVALFARNGVSMTADLDFINAEQSR